MNDGRDSTSSDVARSNPAGTSSEVYGKPPFRVVVGNASDVRLTYNGREVDLAFVRIESSVCTGCGLCVQPCAPNAIVHYAPVSPIKLVNMGCGSCNE